MAPTKSSKTNKTSKTSDSIYEDLSKASSDLLSSFNLAEMLKDAVYMKESKSREDDCVITKQKPQNKGVESDSSGESDNDEVKVTKHKNNIEDSDDDDYFYLCEKSRKTITKCEPKPFAVDEAPKKKEVVKDDDKDYVEYKKNKIVKENNDKLKKKKIKFDSDVDSSDESEEKPKPKQKPKKEIIEEKPVVEKQEEKKENIEKERNIISVYLGTDIGVRKDYLPYEAAEYVNPERLYWVKYFYLDREIDNLDKREELANKLDWLMNNLDRKTNMLNVVYRTNTVTNLGRHYAYGVKYSYQMMHGTIRHILACKDYYDFDIVACGPTIIYNLCKKYNEKEKGKDKINISVLSEYLSNRESILKKIVKEVNDPKITRKEAKEVFTIILGGGSIPDKFEDNKFIQSFKREINDIHAKLVSIHEKAYEYLRKHPSKKRQLDDTQKSSPKGSLCHYIIGIVEWEIIHECINYLKREGFEIGTIIYDGFLIRKTKEFTDETMSKLTDHISKVTGFDIKFLIKDMSDGDQIPEEELDQCKQQLQNNSILNKLSNKEYDEVEENKVIINDDDDITKYTVKYFAKNKDIIVSKKENKVYIRTIPNTGIYSVVERSKSQIIISDRVIEMMDNVTFYKEEKKYDRRTKSFNTELVKAIESISKRRSIKNWLCEALIASKSLVDEDFPLKMMTSNLGKICFIDGYYDFDLGKFKKWDDSVVTPIYMERKYRRKEGDHRDDDCTNFIKKEIYEEKQKIINDMMGKIFWKKDGKYEYFMQWIARAVAGKIEDKTWMIGEGLRNCGKGAIVELLTTTLKEYMGSFESRNFLLDKYAMSADCEKDLAFLMKNAYKRVNVSNEIPVESAISRPIVDGIKIKGLISSGGDIRTGRMLYENSSQFLSQGKFIFFCNSFPEIQPQDTVSTLSAIRFEAEFKPIDEIDDTDRMANKQKSFGIFPQDPNLKSRIRVDKVLGEVFFDMITSYFLPDDKKPIPPQCVKGDTNVFKNIEKNPMFVIKRLFKVGSCVEGKRMLRSSVWKHLEEYNNADFKDNRVKAEFNVIFKKLAVKINQGGTKEHKGQKMYVNIQPKTVDEIHAYDPEIDFPEICGNDANDANEE